MQSTVQRAVTRSGWPVAVVLMGWLMACSDTDRPAVAQAEQDVLAIHDAVMPKMDDLLRAQRQLRARLARLDSTAGDGTASLVIRLDDERNQGRRLLRQLLVADSLMTRWMAQYRYDTLATLPTPEALRYLDAQKASITDVNTQVNESLEHTRQFLAIP